MHCPARPDLHNRKANPVRTCFTRLEFTQSLDFIGPLWRLCI